MKKIFLSILMILTLCFTLTGCTSEGYYKFSKDTKEYHFDDIEGVKEIHYTYNIPKFKSDDVKELDEFLQNEALELSYYYPNDFADYFVDPELDFMKDYIFDEVYNGYVECNTKDLVSVLVESYSYTGGAHGLTTCYGKNYDVKNKKFVKYEDVFCDGFEEELAGLIDEKLSNPEEGEDYGLFPFYKDSLTDIFTPGFETFYFTEDGITFIYGEYLIAPYASGNIFVEIPYEELNHLLKDEYKK